MRELIEFTDFSDYMQIILYAIFPIIIYAILLISSDYMGKIVVPSTFVKHLETAKVFVVVSH